MPADRSVSAPPIDWSGQALVLGGGMAGMLAARALADTFEQVTIIERHAQDLGGGMASAPRVDRPGAASALPQVLSERSRFQLERLFPDLSAELTADGAAMISEPGADRDGARLQFTQRFIQRHLSHRLASIDAIATLRGHDVLGLVGEGERCVGVRVLARTHSAAARSIPADLVVDAMGAESRLCIWLDDIWRIRIPTEQQQISWHYASRLYQLSAGSLPDAVVVDSRPAYPYRGVIMAVEDGNYLAIVACPGSSPLNSEKFNQLLSSFGPSTVAASIASGRPVGPVSVARSSLIRRRRFDRVRDLPAGLVALGASVCSFDPFYGPDFEAAVLEAATLAQILGDQHRYGDGRFAFGLPRRYFRAVTQILDDTWQYGWMPALKTIR